jgi:hypothetical protein
MADEDLSDEQLRQLLKDAEQRLRSKSVNPEHTPSLQRYVQYIQYSV